MRILNSLLIFCVFYYGCAHTLNAPLKPVKKSEIKNSLSLNGIAVGLQSQMGISENLEIGFDLTYPYLGGDLRYHLNKTERSLHSFQFGLDLTGAIANYMYTYQTKVETYIRFGPQLSYQIEKKDWEGFNKLYSTFRIGCSITYGGSHWWITLGYSHPVYKDYPDLEWRPFSSGMNKLLYGNPVFSPEYRIGYTF